MFLGVLSYSAPLNVSACQEILNVVFVYIVEILTFLMKLWVFGAGSSPYPRDLNFFVVDT